MDDRCVMAAFLYSLDTIEESFTKGRISFWFPRRAEMFTSYPGYFKTFESFWKERLYIKGDLNFLRILEKGKVCLRRE
jgi:hypothetical protein